MARGTRSIDVTASDPIADITDHCQHTAMSKLREHKPVEKPD
jgi:hypothetical protein